MKTKPGALGALALLCVSSTLPAQTRSSRAPQAAKPDYAIRVGSDGLTASELQIYFRRAARKHRTSWKTLPAEARKRARQQAIDDEILFQEAVRAGLLEHRDIRPSILARYESSQTTAKLRPSRFTKEEIEAYYNAHKREFMTPAEAKLHVRVFPKVAPETDIRYFHTQALLSPRHATGGWKDLGWNKIGNRFRTPLSAKQLEPLYAMRKGSISKILRDSYGTSYVFWVEDTRAPRQLPLYKARAKVVHRMIQAKTAEKRGALNRRLGRPKPGQSRDAQKFKAALAARLHRDWNTRRRVINTFLAQKKQSAADVLRRVRGRYRVSSPSR